MTNSVLTNKNLSNKKVNPKINDPKKVFGRESLAQSQVAFLLAMAVVLVVWRLVPHAPNFSPLVALALLFGSTLGLGSVLLVLGLQSMVDAYLGVDATWMAVNASIALVVVLGSWFRSSVHGKRWYILAPSIALLSSLIFFLVTNFAVWALTDMYAKTSAGLWMCFIAGVPFFKNMVVGDLMMTAAVVGLWRTLQAKEMVEVHG